MRRKLAAGNWKMNGTTAALAEVEALTAGFSAPECEVLLCPPATLDEREQPAPRSRATRQAAHQLAVRARGGPRPGSPDTPALAPSHHPGTAPRCRVRRRVGPSPPAGKARRRRRQGRSAATVAAALSAFGHDAGSR